MVRWILGFFPVAFAMVVLTGAASALSVNSGGVAAARSCPDFFCGSPTMTLAAPTAGTGSVDLDIVLGKLSFSIDVGQVILTPTGSDDLGVTEWRFENVNYSASNIDVRDIGGVWTIEVLQFGAISGDEVQVGVGYSGALPAINILLTGSCTSIGPSATCGFTFERFSNALTLDPNVAAVTRNVETILNVTAIPEPNTALLSALGLAGLALRPRGGQTKCGFRRVR